MALTFRKVVRPERDEAQRILWSAFTPYVRNLGREITTHHYTFLPAAIERGDVYFAVDGDEIVGVAATERRDGGIYIDRLGVDPARQGAGLGSFMLEWLEGDRVSERAEGPRARRDGRGQHPALSQTWLRDHWPRLAVPRHGRLRPRPHGEGVLIGTRTSRSAHCWERATPEARLLLTAHATLEPPPA
jgi:GNAT superfamily N-acetyltransferase